MNNNSYNTNYNLLHNLFLSYITSKSNFINIDKKVAHYLQLARSKIKKGNIYCIEPQTSKWLSTKNKLIIRKLLHKKGGKYTFSKKSKLVSLHREFKHKNIDIIRVYWPGSEMQILNILLKIIDNPNLRVIIKFNPEISKFKVDSLLEVFQKLQDCGFETFLIDNKNRNIVRLSKNKNEWNKYIFDKITINLLCVKKENSKLITFFSHSSLLEGAEKALLEYIDASVREGFLCHIIIPTSGPLEKELKKRPVSYSILSLPWWTKQQNENRKIYTNLKYLALSLIIDNFKKIDPSIVCTNTSVINIGALAAYILGIPHIWSIHEFGLKEYGISFEETFRERCEFMNMTSDKIIFNSKTIKDYYIKYIDNNKSVILHNAIEFPVSKISNRKYFKDDHSLKLLILGSIYKGKRQEDAILALAKLKEKKMNIELLIVGNNITEYKSYLVKLIKKYKLQNVRFLDFIKKPKHLIESCDIMINCSPMESFGRVTIEAMKLGKPVIGTKSGGTLELVQNEKTGLLFDPQDPLDLARKIRYFYNHRDKLKKMGDNAYNINKNKYSRREFAMKLSNIINSVKTKHKSNINIIGKIFRKTILEQSYVIRNYNKTIKNENLMIQNKNLIIEKLKRQETYLTNELESIQSSYWYRLINSKRWYILYTRQILSSFMKLVKKIL